MGITKLVSFKFHRELIFERRVGKVFGMRTFGKTNFKIVKISSKYLLLVFSEFADFIQLQVFFSIHFSKF